MNQSPGSCMISAVQPAPKAGGDPVTDTLLVATIVASPLFHETCIPAGTEVKLI